jgi:hypothetical protein
MISGLHVGSELMYIQFQGDGTLQTYAAVLPTFRRS